MATTTTTETGKRTQAELRANVAERIQLALRALDRRRDKIAKLKLEEEVLANRAIELMERAKIDTFEFDNRSASLTKPVTLKVDLVRLKTYLGEHRIKIGDVVKETADARTVRKHVPEEDLAKIGTLTPGEPKIQISGGGARTKQQREADTDD
jgi:hypothetical protein